MKNTEQYISSRTRRNVARFHQELLSEDLQKRYDEVNQPPPLAESIIQSVFTPPPPLQPHLSEDSLLLPRQLSGDRGGVSGKGKKKAGMFGFFKKIFRRKKTKSLQVNLNDFSSVSSKESLEKTLLARRSSFPTSLGPPSEKKADGEQSVNSNEVSGGSSASEVFTRIKSTASVFSNVSNESDKTSLSDHSEHIDEFPDEQYSELPSTVSHLRMTFSRDEDDIQKRVSKGEFAIRIPKLRPDLRTAGMVKLSADSEESQADHSPKIYNQSSTLTTNPTLSSSAEEVNINRAHSSALTTTETSPLNLRRTSSSLSPGGTTKTAPTVTIAADVVDNSMQKDYTNGGSTFSLTSKLKSEKNLKRAQLSTRMSRSFMVRPGSQISALSPLNRVPSSLEPSLSPTLWRPTSQPVLSQQPHVQIVPRYNSTSAIPTAKPTEEFFAGLPYQPAFQSFYAKSFYIPKSPTANTAMALHEFNFPPPLSIPTYSEYGFPVVESNLPTNTTSKTTNATMTPAMHSFYVPSSPYPRAPPTALRRKNSNLRYETVDATEQSHYGEIQNFNSLSQFFNSEPFVSAPPHPPTQHHTVHSHPPSHPPPPIHQIYQHSSHSYTSSSASYDPSVTLTANYYDYSDLSEDHSYSNEPTYIELQRKRERKYEAAKKKRDIEKLNEVALREAIQLSLEEQKSQSSNRTKKYEEIERANEEGLRLALLLSMQEVKNRSQQSMETLTNSSSSNPNTNRNSLTKNNSGLNSSNGSKPQSRPLSRASNFPTEEYPYALKQQHYPSSASHSHSPSPPPPSVSGSMHYSGSLQHQMKKISSGSLSGGVQSRESRGSSSANYSPVPGMSSSNASETQPQRRTRRIQRIVLDSNTGGKITGLNL